MFIENGPRDWWWDLRSWDPSFKERHHRVHIDHMGNRMRTFFFTSPSVPIGQVGSQRPWSLPQNATNSSFIVLIKCGANSGRQRDLTRCRSKELHPNWQEEERKRHSSPAKCLHVAIFHSDGWARSTCSNEWNKSWVDFGFRKQGVVSSSGHQLERVEGRKHLEIPCQLLLDALARSWTRFSINARSQSSACPWIHCFHQNFLRDNVLFRT